MNINQKAMSDDPTSPIILVYDLVDPDAFFNEKQSYRAFQNIERLYRCVYAEDTDRRFIAENGSDRIRDSKDERAVKKERYKRPSSRSQREIRRMADRMGRHKYCADYNQVFCKLANAVRRIVYTRK